MLTAVRRGTAEPAAFRRAAELTPEPAAARTYKLFAAGAERGVDLAAGLRALSEDLRDARREEIRKTATKRRAAMLVPTIAVLAPVMLLFIAAPLPVDRLREPVMAQSAHESQTPAANRQRRAQDDRLVGTHGSRPAHACRARRA